MKVELEKSFLMPGATDVAWSFLQDIEGVAACMPGAKITERIDDKHYKGTVTVKLGPASMSFRGELEVVEMDASRRTLHLLAKGSDTSGSSAATMDLVARIESGAADGSINLVGRSVLTMSGKAAAFGGRMMGTVADQILKQFAGNFAGQVQARGEASACATGAGAADATNTPAKELNTLALFWAALRDWFRGLFRRRAA